MSYSLFHAVRLKSSELNSNLVWILEQFNIDANSFIQWVLCLLLIQEPCSSMIQIVLKKYEPIHKADINTFPSTGSFIGKMECLFILLMLSLHQYAVLGLILTAKSITRYKKISEDPQFSEYYLIGTLLSSLFVIILFLCIFSQ